MGTTIESKNPVDAFLDNLIATAKLDALDADYLKVYRAQLLEKLTERIGFVAMQKLPEAELANAEALAEAEKTDELMALFQRAIPDFQELLKKTFLEFREQFLASVTATRASLAK